MTYKAVRTEKGIVIKDDNESITTCATWPPNEDETLEVLFDEANISTPQKELFKVLFGIVELEDERSDTS